MKALVIRQPWADLVVDGHKTIENRSWSTAYRGPLLIVAAKALDKGAHWSALPVCFIAGVLDVPESGDVDAVAFFGARDFGAIIGVVDLVEVHHPSSSGGQGPWSERGEMHWELVRAHRFDIAIPYKGRLDAEAPDYDEPDDAMEP